ncbi:GA module-containing protein [Mycoplasmopsis gallinacea]|uniref:Extracellular matrix-binding protein ebh GA module domain-containing protein n=1 Tax=Mycoplasmopsis gallinacea TaxID=29556 RepID=A0A6H0V134_9BACT|nr:GA module-containing protein [Mycoplasmopsis gallinacea]QIW62051.1 hypothetical protein GOQ20_01060 [Mycoplasmopsis gallinacea]
MVGVAFLPLSFINIQTSKTYRKDDGQQITFDQFNNFISDNKWTEPNFSRYAKEWNNSNSNSWSVADATNGAETIEPIPYFYKKNVFIGNFIKDGTGYRPWDSYRNEPGGWFIGGRGFSKADGTKTFKIAFHRSTMRLDERRWVGGFYISNDLVLTGNIIVSLFSLDRNNNVTNRRENTDTINWRFIGINENDDYNTLKQINPFKDNSALDLKDGNDVKLSVRSIDGSKTIPFSWARYYSAYEGQEKRNQVNDIIMNRNVDFNDGSGTGTFLQGLKLLPRDAFTDTPYNSMSRNLGAYFEFYVLTESNVESNNGVIIEFTVKPNDREAEPGQSPMEYVGESFVGAGISIPHKYIGQYWFGSLGFHAQAKRNQTWIKRFITKEKVKSYENVADQINYTEDEELPQTTLEIYEPKNGARTKLYDVNKDRFDDVKFQKSLKGEKNKSYFTKNIFNDESRITSYDQMTIKVAFKNEQDKKKWKIKDEYRILTGMSTDLRNYWSFEDIEYDLTDRYKLIKLIDKSEYLTKAQKDYLKNDYLNQLFGSTDVNDFPADDTRSFQSAVTEIKRWDLAQKSLELAYQELKSYTTSDNKTLKNGQQSEYTNREDYIFSDKTIRDEIETALENAKPFADLQTTSNPSGKDRNSADIPLMKLSEPTNNNLKTSLLALKSKLSKMNGRTYLDAEKQKLDNNNLSILQANSANITKAKELFNSYSNQIANGYDQAASKAWINNDLTNNPQGTLEREKLNNYVQKVTELSNEYDKLKELHQITSTLNQDSPVVKYSEDSIKNSFNQDNTSVNNLVNGIQNGTTDLFSNTQRFEEATNNSNQNSVKNTRERLETTLKQLDGNKREAIKELDGFKNLTSPNPQGQNVDSKAKVNALPSNFVDNGTSITNNLVNNNVELGKIMNEAWETAKTNFKEKINALSNLTDTQKEHFKNQVTDDKKYSTGLLYFDDRNLDFTNPTFSNLTPLNTNMGDLKSYYDSLESSMKDGTDERYLFADLNYKNEYEKQLLRTKQFLGIPLTEAERNSSNYVEVPASELVDPTKVQEAKNQLEAAKNNLNGIPFSPEIEKLAYLSDTLKSQIKKEKETLNNQAPAIINLREKAIELNNKAKELIDLMKDVVQNKQNENYADYANASDETKNPFDEEINLIKDLFEGDFATNGDVKLKGADPEPSSWTDFTNSKITQVQERINQLKAKLNALDGEEIKAEQERINNLAITYDYPNDLKRNILPSEVAASEHWSEFTHTVQPENAQDFEVRIVDVTPQADDFEPGTVNVTYEVVSTKFPSISKRIVSTKNQDITGFLTAREKEFRLKKAEIIEKINNLANQGKLTPEQKAQLLNEVNALSYENGNTPDDLNLINNKIDALVDANKVIDDLPNLTDDQKAQLKSRYLTDNSPENINKIQREAQNLDDLIGKLKEKIQAAENTKNEPIYTKDQQDRKDAFDQALEEAKNKLNEILAKDLTNEDLPTLAKEIDNPDQTQPGVIQKLDKASDDLDGNRHDLLSKVRNFAHLEADDLTWLDDEINRLPKRPTEQQQKAILNKALERCKLNAKKKIKALKLLTDAEKQAYEQEIDQITLHTASNGIDPEVDSNNQQIKYNVDIDSILERANQDELTKRKAIGKLYGDNELSILPAYEHLNDNQKAYLKNLIINNPTSETTRILQEAQDTNDAMKMYKDLFVSSDNQEPNNVKPSDKTDYLDASENVKNLFDLGLENRDSIVASNGELKTLDELISYKKDSNNNFILDENGNKVIDLENGLIGNLIKARNDLDGDERLAKRKEELAKRLDKDNSQPPVLLEFLIDNQLEKAKEKLADSSIDRISKVDDLEDNLVHLNDEMQKMLMYIESKNGNPDKGMTPFTQTLMYTGSFDDKRKAYDDALKEAEEYLATLKASNNPDEILNSTKLEEINKKIAKAIENLDGEKNMDKLQNEALEKINSYQNLNDAQKEMLKMEVLNARTPEDLLGNANKQGLNDKAKELNDQMGILNELTKNEKGENPDTTNTKTTTGYIDSDNEPYEVTNPDGTKSESTLGKKDAYDKYIHDADNLYQPNDVANSDGSGGSTRVDTSNKNAQTDPNVVKELIVKLKEAKEALNGDDKFGAEKERLLKSIHNQDNELNIKYPNLNPSQIEYFEQEIAKTKSIKELQKLELTISKLNSAMGHLLEQIDLADNDHEVTITNEDGTTSTQTEKAFEKMPKYTEASQKTKDPYDQVKEIMKKLVDKNKDVETKNDEQGNPVQVDTDLIIEPSKIDQILNDYLVAKENLDGDNTFNLEKEATINEIKNNSYLNLAQKKDLIDKVQASKTKDELNAVKEQIEPLTDAMKKLRDIQNEALETLEQPRYKNSSKDRQDALNNEDPANLGVIQNNKPSVDDVLKHFIPEEDAKNTSQNLTIDQINDLVSKTRAALDNLNGDEELEKAKQKAIELIKGDNLFNDGDQSYNKLNRAQKQYLIDKIQKAILINDDNNSSVNEILEEAKQLNEQMNELDKYIKNTVQEGQNIDPKSRNNYKDASDNLKMNFDNSYNDSLNNLNYDNGRNLSKEQVQELLNKVEKDYNSLDGDSKRDAALDELAKLIQKDPAFKQTDLYLSSEEDKKAFYDKAISGGKNILADKDNVPLSQIKNQIQKIKDAIKKLEDNKELFKKRIDALPNLSDEEKARYKQEIEDSQSFEDRTNIYQKAVANNDGKQKVIDYINSLPNLSPRDKKELIQKVINANGENQAELDKIQDDAKTADALIAKLLNDAKGDHTLSLQEINDITNKLKEIGITNPEYFNLADEMLQFKDLKDTLEKYRSEDISSPTFKETSNKLDKLIESIHSSIYAQPNIRDAWNKLSQDTLKLKDQALSEMRLVESLSNLRFDDFTTEINSDKVVESNKYQEFYKELKDKNFFNLILKDKGTLTKQELATLKGIEKKDASDVLYSVIQKLIHEKEIKEKLSFWWYVALSLTSLGIFNLLYLLYRQKEDKEE